MAGAASTATPEYGVRPALTGSTTIEHNHFNYALSSGGSVSDAIIISNFTDAPLTFHVYGADLVAAQGGGLAPSQEASPVRLVGRWIRVGVRQLTIQAHQEQSDPFTLTVPAGESPGDYLGAVVAAKQMTQSGGIQVATRAALIAEVTVQGTVHLGVSPIPLQAAPTGGDEVFTLLVSNTGNVLFSFTSEVTVRDTSGRTIATLPLSPQNIYVVPGGKATVKTTWHGVPMWADVTAVATVHASRNGLPAGTFMSNTLHLSFFPWLLFGAIPGSVLALLLLAIILVLYLRRRSRGVCNHCRRESARRTLVEVIDAADVSECRRCVKAIRGTTRIVLCTACLRRHLLHTPEALSTPPESRPSGRAAGVRPGRPAAKPGGTAGETSTKATLKAQARRPAKAGTPESASGSSPQTHLESHTREASTTPTRKARKQPVHKPAKASAPEQAKTPLREPTREPKRRSAREQVKTPVRKAVRESTRTIKAAAPNQPRPAAPNAAAAPGRRGRQASATKTPRAQSSRVSPTSRPK